jgi:hypothetical protein
MTTFVVQHENGQVLAVFTDREIADSYAAARSGRTVCAAPLVAAPLAMVTVHTRWVEIDAHGSVCTDQHDSYNWCPDLDTDEAPPLAEIEQYADGSRCRLLAVGTDPGLLSEKLAESLAQAVPSS